MTLERLRVLIRILRLYGEFPLIPTEYDELAEALTELALIYENWPAVPEALAVARTTMPHDFPG